MALLHYLCHSTPLQGNRVGKNGIDEVSLAFVRESIIIKFTFSIPCLKGIYDEKHLFN
jgi:hypothetical protein